jgi:hypothetical protein
VYVAIDRSQGEGEDGIGISEKATAGISKYYSLIFEIIGWFGREMPRGRG